MKTTNKNNKKKSEGNKLMKGVIFNVLGLIAVCAVVAAGITYYNNKQYDFWDKNELRIVKDFNVVVDYEKASTALDQDVTDEEEASKEVMEKVDSLKSGMIDFFNQQYGVDVSQKLNKLEKIYVYSCDEYKGQTLCGYVDNEDNTVHLNKKILSDEVLIQSVFTHEAMHYLGITPVKGTEAGMYFIEGLADLLADECLSYQNKKFNGSPYYALAMSLWKQIQVVDSEIIKEAVTKENYDIMSNFDKRLSNVKTTFLKVKSISENLENCIKTINQGISEVDTYFLTLQAQDIVICYCKTFNPSKKQIDKIREYYVLEDYEDIVVKRIGEQYYIK